MKNLKDFLEILSAVLLFFILPLVVFTIFTSKTSVFGIQSFVVVSGSMAPNIPVGSIVYSRKQTSYQLGDVISFENDDKTITHRIAKVIKRGNGIFYQTKGDANNADDSSLTPSYKVLGREFFFLPYIGYFIMFLKTIPGFLLFIILPGCLFIALEFKKIKKEIEKEVEKRLLKQMQTT